MVQCAPSIQQPTPHTPHTLRQPQLEPNLLTAATAERRKSPNLKGSGRGVWC